MINQNFSLHEMREDLDFKLFSLDKKHREKEFKITNIAEFLPVGLLVNHISGCNVYMNKISEKVLNLTLAESTALGLEYQSKIMYNREEFERLKPLIDE